MPSMTAGDQNLIMSFLAQSDRKALFADADYDKIMKDLECPTVAAVKARWVRLHTLCTEMYAKGEKFDAGTTKAKATPKKRIIDPSTDTLEVPPTPTKKVRTKKAKAKAKNIEEVEAAAAEETNVAVEE